MQQSEICIDKILIKKYSLFADKVAIFGGSFDPPHLAHFEIIKWLSAHFREVIVVPAYQNPLKNQAMIPFDTRLKWCEIMCQHIKQDINATNIHISDIEGKSNRVVFAYELATHFYDKYFCSKDSSEVFSSDCYDKKSSLIKDSTSISPLCFVIGEDALSNIHKWKNINSLAKLVDFVMLKRNDTKSMDKNPATQQHSTQQFCTQQLYKTQFCKQNLATKAIDSSNGDFKNMDSANAVFTNANEILRVLLVDFAPNDLLKKSLPFLPNKNLSSTFLRKSLMKKTFLQNKQDKAQNQILNAIPQCLRNEVVEFFKKTALQFDF